MSEPHQPEAPGQGETAASSPSLLKQAREASGLHVAALAAALKVPVRKLEDLEAGRFDRLPDMTFARALASSACRHLRIDPAPVLAQLPAASRPSLGPSGTALNAPYQGSADPVPFNPAGWLSRPAVLSAIALLLGALVIVFLPKAEESAAPVWGEAAPATTPAPTGLPSGNPEPAVPVNASTPAADGPVADAVAAAPATIPASPSTSSPAADVAPVAAVPGPAPAAVAAPAPAEPVAPAPTVMAIAARAETWVEVTTPAGETVVRRLLTAGESMEVNRAPPYAVVIGRAEAARVTLRGQAFDLPAPSSNGVARFEVK